MARFSCLLALPFAASALLAADLVHCPPKIAVKQQLAVLAPGWAVSIDDTPHPMAGLTFFDGKPEEKASLAPDRETKTGGGSVLSWTFGGSARPLWVACHYDWTDVTLTRELPKTTRACSVTYGTRKSIAGLPVIEKIDCK